jgi:hypothetical protein
LTGYNFEAQIRLRPDLSTSSLGVVREHEIPQANVIENFLRFFAAHHVLARGGALLHSAGLVYRQQSWIFVGRSGSGKTTLARKAQQNGIGVLSDDINVVLRSKGSYFSCPVPFAGELGRDNDQGKRHSLHPVAGIVFLEHGEGLETKQLKTSGAIARLLAACPFVNSDPEQFGVLFDVLSNLVDKLPITQLYCQKTDSINDIMKAVNVALDRG